MKRKLAFVAGLLLLLLVGVVTRTLHRGGAFLSIEAFGPAPLRIIDGFPGGTEDLVIRPGGTEAFVSSANFRDSSVRGGVFLVDLLTGAKRDVTSGLEMPFQPHGIDLWVGTDGTQRLFAVNHPRGSGFTGAAAQSEPIRHAIELFDVAPNGTLKHRQTFHHASLISPNDVAAAGPNSFYVSNDHGLKPGVARVLEDYLQLPLGNVVYFDGSAYRVVHTGTVYANGVKVSRDGEFVYLAETTGGRVSKFSRETNGDLSLIEALEDLNGVDNISVDDHGNLWIVGHPKLLEFVSHAEDPNHLSATKVWKITTHPSLQVEALYLDAGDTISAGSVGARGDGVFVLGAVFQGKLVVLPPLD